MKAFKLSRCNLPFISRFDTTCSWGGGVRFSLRPLYLEGIFSGTYWLYVLAGFPAALDVSEERNISFHG